MLCTVSPWLEELTIARRNDTGGDTIPPGKITSHRLLDELTATPQKVTSPSLPWANFPPYGS